MFAPNLIQNILKDHILCFQVCNVFAGQKMFCTNLIMLLFTDLLLFTLHSDTPSSKSVRRGLSSTVLEQFLVQACCLP